jgi:TPR repeat protein
VNYEEAVQYFIPAAKAGHAGAQNTLGVMLEEGLGISKNIHEAIKMFRAAAEQGEPRAMLNMGRMCDSGPSPDPAQACMWLLLSAQKQEDGAEKYLRNLLETGRVSQQHVEEGRKRAAAFRVKKP